MNYKKIYESLITKAKYENILDNVYYEKHHIIPKCMGGKDNDENMVALTPRQHYIAHALLFKIYKNTKYAYMLASALNYMTTHNTKSRVSVSRSYEMARIVFSKNHPCKNEDVKNKISEKISALHLNGFYEKHNNDKKLKFIYNCGYCKKEIIIMSKSERKRIPKYCSQECAKLNLFLSDDYKQKLKCAAKKRMSNMTEHQKQEFYSKTLRSKSINREEVNKKISESKKLYDEEILNLTDDEIHDKLSKMEKYRKDGKRNGNFVRILKIRGLEIDRYY